MENIRMEIVTKFPDNNYDLNTMSCMWNAFEFKYHHNSEIDVVIPFDFDAWTNTFEKEGGYVYIKAISGTGEYFNDYSISKDYIPDILKAGVDPEMLSAIFMSMATEIVEFGCDVYEKTILDVVPEIVSIAFVGDTMVPFYVDNEVVKAFNNKHS